MDPRAWTPRAGARASCADVPLDDADDDASACFGRRHRRCAARSQESWRRLAEACSNGVVTAASSRVRTSRSASTVLSQVLEPRHDGLLRGRAGSLRRRIPDPDGTSLRPGGDPSVARVRCGAFIGLFEGASRTRAGRPIAPRRPCRDPKETGPLRGPERGSPRPPVRASRTMTRPLEGTDRPAERPFPPWSFPGLDGGAPRAPERRFGVPRGSGPGERRDASGTSARPGP
ncbi:hypothetical protein B0O41_3957 [Propionibacteriaceae bacterium ES.041]|nr:hypothetical protein B0O41_3957 [Propionibacteriaceae bacterium ES.041]